VLEGVGVSAGFAVGPVHLVETGLAAVPEYSLAEDQIDAEVARFEQALGAARRQVGKLRRRSAQLPGAVSEELGLMLDAHAAMLSSRRTSGAIVERIRARQLNAEAAVQHVMHELAEGFAAVRDPYLASKVQDVRDVGGRILRQLTATPYQALSRLPAGVVVVADELSPADAALMDPSRIAGLVTALGGAEGHTAIMARSMGLPAVLGVQGIVQAARGRATVIVDGAAGRVVVDPTPETIAEYRRKAAARQRLERQLARLRALPAATRDGFRVAMLANVDLERDVAAAISAGAEGVGLLRTEYMFMNRDDLPGEDEQYAMLRAVVEAMQGRTVTIRTLDVGGEKLAAALGDRFSGSANPALGLRGIRLSLKHPKLLETQLAAIMRAGAHGPVRILLPMISGVGQVRALRTHLARVMHRLKRRRERIAAAPPPVGVMIEVPGAALIADALALEVDFFAIGTNDLTQYTLAIDRGDEQVAALFNPMHPAVLRLVQFAAAAAQRAGIPVSVCGEVAGDPRCAALLVGMGLRELSMAAQSIPRVKQRVRALDMGAAARRSNAILDQADEARVSALLDDFNEGL
jgi:phosphoenolpyruvate-protein phosphotransferase (PTS system enzyme I)